MKKVKMAIGILLCSALVLGGCGGSGNSPASTSGSKTESTGSSASSAASASSASSSSGKDSGEKLTFEYFATSMTVEWIQQIEEALKTLGEENNFEVLSADANRDINTQLSQIDTAIEQKIDGAFLFIVDEGSAPAAVQKFDDAEIPVIGETLKLQDAANPFLYLSRNVL